MVAFKCGVQLSDVFEVELPGGRVLTLKPPFDLMEKVFAGELEVGDVCVVEC